MYNQVLLVAPAGGSISGAAVSSGTGEFVQSTLYGHEVWVGSVNLYAQESATVTYSVTVAPGDSELEYHQTPWRRARRERTEHTRETEAAAGAPAPAAAFRFGGR